LQDKCSIAFAQEQRGHERAQQQVLKAVAIEVSGYERIGGADTDQRWCTEGSVAVSRKDQQRAVKLADRRVRDSIAIEIGRRYSLALVCVQCECIAESTVGVAEIDIVGRDQIKVAVAIQIRGDQLVCVGIPGERSF